MRVRIDVLVDRFRSDISFVVRLFFLVVVSGLVSEGWWAIGVGIYEEGFY